MKNIFSSQRGLTPLVIVLIVVVVALVGGGIYFSTRQEVLAPGTENNLGGTQVETNTMPVPGSNTQEIIVSPSSYTVEMTPEGFSPSMLEILKGDTVNFVNKDTKPRWPASGMHPTHLLCPGFDSLKGIAPGETYSFTFTEAKTCPMHDHISASLRGQIIVK